MGREAVAARSRRTRRRPLILVALAVTLCGTLAGFDVLRDSDGASVKWPSRGVAVFIEARGHNTLTAAQIGVVTQKAIKTWNAALPGAMKLVWGGLVAEDPRFDIFIRMATKGFQERTDNPTGRLRIDATGDELKRVRIELDAQHFEFSTTPTFSGKLNADLQAVLTHQLGHALGLGFSRDRKAATYYFAVTAAQRALGEDDRRGVRWLYGDEAPTNGALCEPCDGDEQCDGRCLTWPGEASYCARDCVEHNDCPIGYSCGSWPGGKACLPNDRHCAPDKAEAVVSARCANDYACPDQLFCLATGGEGFCTAGCQGFCGGFGQCRQVQLGNQVIGLCLASQNRAFGVPCEVAPDCGSLVCAPSIHGGGKCTSACASGCPKGASCDADGRFCVKPGDLDLGWPCESGFDCASGQCVDHGTTFARVCAVTCTSPVDCPTGTGCTPTPEGMFCLPFGTPPAGAPCTTAGACGKGSVCDSYPMPGVGRCAPRCDPYATAATCPAGMRCVWAGKDAGTTTEEGVCRASGPGGIAGAACDTDAPCRADLVCTAVQQDGMTATTGSCQAVCDPNQNLCTKGRGCQPLAGLQPQPSTCVDPNEVRVQVAIPPPSFAPPNFAARPLVLKNLRPYGVKAPKDSTGGGCHASRAGGVPMGSLLWFYAMCVAVVSRRRRSRT